MILDPVQRWYCPNCPTEAVKPARYSSPGDVVVEFHHCPALHGLTAPLLLAGTKAKVEAVEREDYVGSEIVQTDDTGRPVMAVHTTRDDGEDTIVFAPAVSITVN